jgi:hypothetical protein
MAESAKDRYLANWRDEIDSAALYRVVADAERDDAFARVYRRLGEVDEAHQPARRSGRRLTGGVSSRPQTLGEKGLERPTLNVRRRRLRAGSPLRDRGHTRWSGRWGEAGT